MRTDIDAVREQLAENAIKESILAPLPHLDDLGECLRGSFNLPGVAGPIPADVYPLAGGDPDDFWVDCVSTIHRDAITEIVREARKGNAPSNVVRLNLKKAPAPARPRFKVTWFRDIEAQPVKEHLIPGPIDQNRCAHWRNPMDMMRQG